MYHSTVFKHENIMQQVTQLS